MTETIVDSLVVRTAGPEDIDPIRELLKISLGEGRIPRSRAYWSWKHQENPFGASPALVAEEEGRIVGLRVFMRWEWLAGGRTVRAVRAVDTATHPDWRGRRIFTRLTLDLVGRMQREGVAFVFNTPNDLSRPGYIKMGWTNVGRVSIWVRPRRPWAMVRSLMKGGSGEAEEDEAPETPGRESLARLLERPELEDLLEARNAGRRLTTARSREYLRWRYLDVPDFGYGAALDVERDGGAAIVGRLRRRGSLRELRICETLVGPNAASRRLLSKVTRRMIDESDPDYVAAMAAPGTPERRALLGSGFVPVPRSGPTLTVRPLTPVDGIDPTRRADWRLSIGDLELF